MEQKQTQNQAKTEETQFNFELIRNFKKKKIHIKFKPSYK